MSTGFERYDGPIEPGMTFWAPDNEGQPYRRDRVIAIDPTRPDTIILEALSCPMRKRPGSGVGEIFRCPEVNLRIVMRPEEES